MTDKQMDMTKLIVNFRNFTNASITMVPTILVALIAHHTPTLTSCTATSETDVGSLLL
jgi:hypothetical protein